MNRRQFLKYQFNGALYLAAGAAGLLPAGRSLAAETVDLGVAQGSPAAATRAAVELLGGMSRFVKKGDRVVIKPNMSFTTPPERASNTHPEVVKALAIMCLEAGAADIKILDNPLSSARRCLESAGIRDACRSLDNVSVRMIEKESLYREVDLPGPEKLSRTAVMKDVLKSDVLIAAPVAKSHSGSGVSLSMKGMMGLVYDRWTFHRLDLHTTVVDLVSFLRPDLVVIDASRVLSTGGPGGPGKVLKPNLIFASRDMVAADAYTVSRFEWYGRYYKPRQVRHILEAHQRGLGRMDVENLTVKTVSV